ncbi:tripartite tricarboxylate transporter substrate binding protein [Bradyrhizobium lablabi]|uniref:Bug family tripartite tricarboxylate transporter substrate binding protein n=1 Tax=Bradyrhizobium lablabi TaxID=722472 RepID=UPI001BA9828D|nr:tripartite tricarboxylate transporter substrate binding protein [Bradyrhizobium lablabi]MBR1121275.1 tripartite tricarboxylate transporter substrate binding protein [Bradyrhizobium lablabi]
MKALLTGAAIGLLALTAPAIAQDYPGKPIRLIVGFAAGGGNDIIARVFGQKLSESLGQPVIVENKPGGGAIVATDYVAKSAPDGYTLLMSASGISINPAVYAKLPYDAINDFVAVSELAAFPLIMIVAQDSPIKSVAELVAFAKANPDKTNYGSSSASFQLVTELFKMKTGAPMQAIPYKSANESVLAVVSEQVTTTIADAGPVLQQVKGGTARALAVATAKRIDDLPDVPTLKEAGADVEAVLWSGIFVPKGTPPAIVKKLEGEFMRIAKMPDVIAKLKPIGIETIGNSSEEFAKILADDIARWSAVAKAANIKMEQ